MLLKLSWAGFAIHLDSADINCFLLTDPFVFDNDVLILSIYCHKCLLL